MVYCFINGNKCYHDKNNNEILRYVSDDEICNKNNIRKCPKCNQNQTDEGHDYCIANLGTVLNACCGHGNEEGYVQFDNGITIRGYFNIERKNDDCFATKIIKNENHFSNK